MNYENIKSFLLTMLVIMSLVLTWSLWTYQPNLGVIESTEFISDVEIGEKRDAASLIFPEKVLFHKNGSHYGATDHTTVNDMMEYMRTWRFEELSDITIAVGQEYLNLIHGQDGIEIIFPSELSVETLKTIINFDDEISSSVTFDRVIIPMIPSQQEDAVAYFVSYKSKNVFQAKLNNFSYKSFSKDVYQVSIAFPQYSEYQVNDKHSIFLQSNPVKANQITYYSIKYPSQDFKEALFTDQSFVKQDSANTGEITYSDGSRAMFINSSSDMLEYVNPAPATDRSMSSAHDTIQKSIDFVNDHSGWTDSYQFSEWNPLSQSTTFRLYIHGLPVYAYSGLSRIKLTWDGANSFNTYIRPMFKLHLSIDSETSAVELPSGDVLIDILQNITEVDMDQLEDAKVAYELKKDFSSAKVTVEPIWVVKQNGEWHKVIFDENIKERGGTIIELE
ncbi:YycH family regulatory protein [Bacillus sp. AK128]